MITFIKFRIIIILNFWMNVIFRKKVTHFTNSCTQRAHITQLFFTLAVFAKMKLFMFWSLKTYLGCLLLHHGTCSSETSSKRTFSPLMGNDNAVRGY